MVLSETENGSLTTPSQLVLSRVQKAGPESSLCTQARPRNQEQSLTWGASSRQSQDTLQQVAQGGWQVHRKGEGVSNMDTHMSVRLSAQGST
jgi:hypothetical protein